MKKELDFQIPFSGFASTTFTNCFTSTYLFLEGIEISGIEDYPCNHRESGYCSQCGNCGKTAMAQQEKYFHLFDTFCGRSSLRSRFDGEPTEMQKLIGETEFDGEGTDDTVAFLFGYAGYEYRKLTDSSVFRAEIRASVDSGKPVIVKLKEMNGCFRVITGYDGDTLLCPDFGNAQEKPEGAPAWNELVAVYRIGDKTPPVFTFSDGLKRIRQVMEYNLREKLWDGYIEKMGLYSPDSLARADLEEKKARMKRVAETMWHCFNSHNFAEVFRQRIIPELQRPAFDEICQKIGGPLYGYTHDLAWALIGLEECADWTKYYAHYWGEMVTLTLQQLRDNDIAVLEEVKRMIEILEG